MKKKLLGGGIYLLPDAKTSKLSKTEEKDVFGSFVRLESLLWRVLLRNNWVREQLLSVEEKEEPSQRLLITALRHEDSGRKRLMAGVAFAKQLARENDSFSLLWRRVNAINQAQLKVRKEIITRNLKLVEYFAERRCGGENELEDRLQEGCTGLIRAIELFEPERGWKFSTYASWWISHALLRFRGDFERLVRIPNHRLEHLRGLIKMQEEASRARKPEPTAEQVASFLGVPLKAAEHLMTIKSSAHVSLDSTRGGDGDVCLLDTVASESITGEEIEGNQLRQAIDDIVGHLPVRERDIIRRRFFPAGQEEETLGQIGDTYGLSRERIRQIEVIALAKIKAMMTRRGISAEHLQC